MPGAPYRSAPRVLAALCLLAACASDRRPDDAPAPPRDATVAADARPDGDAGPPGLDVAPPPTDGATPPPDAAAAEWVGVVGTGQSLSVGVRSGPLLGTE